MLNAHILRLLLVPTDRPAFALRREVNLAVTRPPGDNEWDQALHYLQAGGLITLTADPIFGDQRVGLTDSGREAAEKL